MDVPQMYYWISSCGYLIASIKRETEEKGVFSSKKASTLVHKFVSRLKEFSSSFFYRSVSYCFEKLKPLLIKSVLQRSSQLS